MKTRIFGIILMVLGLGIIGAAFGMRYSAERRQKAMIEAFQNTLQDFEQEATGTPPPQVNAQENSGGAAPQNPVTPDKKPSSQDIKALAIMVIPKINITVAVAEGTDMETLKYAVGHFEGTALPGEKGNFCVAGHRSYTYSEYFNRLDELVAGDEIIVRTKKGEFTYIVDGKKVVEPQEVSVLNPTKEPTITLVTCTPVRTATHRLIIKGKLK